MLSDLTPDPALTPRIHAAIDATKESDPEFWKKLCDENDPRVAKTGGVLAIRPGYEGTIEAALRVCEWSAYEYPGVVTSVMGLFRTFDIAGTMDVIDLRTLTPSLPVRLLDPNRTGLSEAFIQRKGEMVPFISITLGPGRPEKGETVWTFHPGPPIVPSTVPTRPHGGSEVTVAEALKLGMRWARCSAP